VELNGIARDFAGRGLQVLECAINGDAAAAIPEFLQRFEVPYPVGYSTAAAAMSYLQYMILDPCPFHVPQMVFIDRTGVIRAQYAGESEFFLNAGPNVRAEIESLLSAAAPAHKK